MEYTKRHEEQEKKDLEEAMAKVLHVCNDVYEDQQNRMGGISDKFIKNFLAGIVCVNIRQLARMSVTFNELKDDLVKDILAMILIGCDVDIDALESRIKDRMAKRKEIEQKELEKLR